MVVLMWTSWCSQHKNRPLEAVYHVPPWGIFPDLNPDYGGLLLSTFFDMNMFEDAVLLAFRFFTFQK